MSVTKSITFDNCYTVLGGTFSALSVAAGTLTKNVIFTLERLLPTMEGQYQVQYAVTVEDGFNKGFLAFDISANSDDEARELADKYIEDNY